MKQFSNLSSISDDAIGNDALFEFKIQGQNNKTSWNLQYFNFISYTNSFITVMGRASL